MSEHTRDLLAALRSLLETQDMDTERPPWTYRSIHRGRVGCCYCGGDGEDANSIFHFDYDGGICPVARAQAAIAKAGPVEEGEDAD